MATIIKIVRTEKRNGVPNDPPIPSNTQTFQQGNLNSTLIQMKGKGNVISFYKSFIVIYIGCFSRR